MRPNTSSTVRDPRPGPSRSAHPTSLLLAALLSLATVLPACSEPALYRAERKLKLVERIRSELLSSAFVERGAVLAVTDDQSKALAAESVADARRVDATLAELRGLVREDGNEPEATALGVFEVDLKGLQEVDGRLLELAVRNTNLKAAALLARDGRESTIALSDALEAAAKDTNDPATLRTIAKCQTSALRSLALLLLHVPSEDEAEMAGYERKIDDRNGEVESGLEQLRKSAALPASRLDEATSGWAKFREVEAEALRLSRENSNVKSRLISLDEKPRALEETLGALDRFEAVVESTLPKSGRSG